MLALKLSRPGRLAATALEQQGLTQYGVKFMALFIQQTGVRKLINASDGEHAMKSLEEVAAKAYDGVEAISRESPVGDHQSNGAIESAVRTLKAQMRTTRFAIEAKLGRSLKSDDVLLTWIPTFAGDTIARFRKDVDGKTPWEKECGRRWAGESLEFGERFFLKEAKERSNTSKKDWEARLIEACFVGQNARTGTILGLTPDGVVQGRFGRRLPEKER